MPEGTEGKCQQCGATLLPKWRFCVDCNAPIPGASRRPQGQLAETLRHLPSTHQPDKTVVFVPEYREERLRRERRNKRALIATAVGCVLVTVVSFAILRFKETKKAKVPQMQRETMARNELDVFAKSIENFRADVGRYPTMQEGLGALLKQPPTVDNWHGPYLERDYSVDPWGRDYVYQAFNDGKSYVVYTYGPEGEAAGRYFMQVNSGTPQPNPTPTP
ncbi:MAG: type II secretion system protein GspG [Acidobacteriota bacterium]|nr:type II secretion system protein GspG [Acidobacteriota bacterium]